MTSLDMNGFSVTLMPANDPALLEHLLAKCAPHTAWPYVSGDSSDLASPDSYPKDPLAESVNAESTNLKNDENTDKIIRAVCDHLVG